MNPQDIHEDKEPKVGEEIPNLCKETFLTKDKAIAILWLVGGLLLSAAGTAVAYAMTTNSSIVTLQEHEKVNASRLDRIEDRIEKKIDQLLDRTDK